ncbi:MAG TPA: hypothetical protein VK797_13885 [Tepidisphaeraceae bacterium]|nr:hypothetical protein [Tepidisphaeraceae bacterium]
MTPQIALFPAADDHSADKAERGSSQAACKNETGKNHSACVDDRIRPKTHMGEQGAVGEDEAEVDTPIELDED